MVLRRHRELPHQTMFGTSGEAQANAAMRILCRLFNFAINEYESEAVAALAAWGNPVEKLSQKRAWYQETRRRTVIPDSKLQAWYQAVNAQTNDSYKDWLLTMVLTGLRRTESASLRWTDVDFDELTLTIRPEVAKNKRLHVIPLSKFLSELFMGRKEKSSSIYVFPGRKAEKHIVSNWRINATVVESSGCTFILHDLRRTFVTAAAKLAIPHHQIKKLVNHVGKSDMTDSYIVCDVEDLREPMEKISQRLLKLMGILPREDRV